MKISKSTLRLENNFEGENTPQNQLSSMSSPKFNRKPNRNCGDRKKKQSIGDVPSEQRICFVSPKRMNDDMGAIGSSTKKLQCMKKVTATEKFGMANHAESRINKNLNDYFGESENSPQRTYTQTQTIMYSENDFNEISKDENLINSHRRESRWSPNNENQLSKENKTLKEEIQKLKYQIANLHSENKRIASENQKITTENQKLLTKNHHLQSQNQVLLNHQKDLSELKYFLLERQGMIAETSENLRLAHQSMHNLKLNLKEKFEEINHKQQLITQLKQDIYNLKTQNIELKEQIQRSNQKEKQISKEFAQLLQKLNTNANSQNQPINNQFQIRKRRNHLKQPPQKHKFSLKDFQRKSQKRVMNETDISQTPTQKNRFLAQQKENGEQIISQSDEIDKTIERCSPSLSFLTAHKIASDAQNHPIQNGENQVLRMVDNLTKKIKYNQIEIDMLRRVKLDGEKAKNDSENLRKQNRKLLQRVQYLMRTNSRKEKRGRSSHQNSSFQLSLSPSRN